MARRNRGAPSRSSLVRACQPNGGRMPIPIENDPTTTQSAPGSSTIDELHPFSRRRALQGVAGIGLLGIAGTVLSACGSDEPASSTAPSVTGQSSEPAETMSSGGGQPSGDEIATTDQVPVGGGLILEDPDKIVITQPESGNFKAFTAVCTHMGCTVGSVEDNVITCPCHGSQYNASTGEVVRGPAPKALAPIQIDVEGNDILLPA